MTNQIQVQSILSSGEKRMGRNNCEPFTGIWKVTLAGQRFYSVFLETALEAGRLHC